MEMSDRGPVINISYKGMIIRMSDGEPPIGMSNRVPVIEMSDRVPVIGISSKGSVIEMPDRVLVKNKGVITIQSADINFELLIYFILLSNIIFKTQ